MHRFEEIFTKQVTLPDTSGRNYSQLNGIFTTLGKETTPLSLKEKKNTFFRLKVHLFKEGIIT